MEPVQECHFCGKPFNWMAGDDKFSQVECSACRAERGERFSMVMKGIEQQIESITRTFGSSPRPDLNGISPLGCCEEHAADFEWFRCHSREDLYPIALTGDPTDFGCSLYPSAYHYFVPAIMLKTLEYIQEPHFYFFQIRDWIGVLVPLKESENDFIKDKLKLFSIEQRQTVASYIRFMNEIYRSQEDCIDADFERAILEIWSRTTLVAD